MLERFPDDSNIPTKSKAQWSTLIAALHPCGQMPSGLDY